MSGGLLNRDELPEYVGDIEDARILGIKPWEIDDVPLFWRSAARQVSLARKEALAEMAKKGNIPKVYVIDI